MMNEITNSLGGPGRPVIGIPAQTSPAKWAVWEREVALVPQVLVDRVVAAGGMPVLLPSVPGVESMVSYLDGLLLPGGPDVDPGRYGASRHEMTRSDNPRRDAAEFAILDAALNRGLPVFGICRGLQLLNIHLGGTLHQYIPDFLGHNGHAPGPASFGPQSVRVEPGSQMAKILGAQIPPVPCHHQQAIDQIGAGLITTVKSEDGVIEAVELADYPFAVAAQWHADEDGYDELFQALVMAASQ